MKSSDIALIVLLAVVSVLVSYWVGGMLLGNPDDDTYSITYVDSIAGDLSQPDDETFNPTSLNPTVEVIIGECSEGEVWSDKMQRCVEEDGKDSNNPDNPENPENPDNPDNPVQPDNPDNPDNPEE